MKITIIKCNRVIYDFLLDINIYYSNETLEFYRKLGVGNCSICSESLSRKYIYIINSLKKTKLLPKDYKILCCACLYEENLKKKERKDYDYRNK